MGVKKATPYRKQTVLPEDSFLDRAKEWAKSNTRAVIGAGVAIVIAAVLVGAIVFHERSGEARARSEYASIASGLPGQAQDNAADWNKVIPGLQKFIANHADSSATLDARMELARGYFYTKNYAGAVKAGEEALGAAPRGSSLKPLILYQLAYAYESAGKPDEAARTWRALKKLGLPALEREADWNLGGIFQEKKQLPEAVEMYELALQAPGDYPSGPQIDSRLARIKTAKKK